MVCHVTFENGFGDAAAFMSDVRRNSQTDRSFREAHYGGASGSVAPEKRAAWSSLLVVRGTDWKVP